MTARKPRKPKEPSVCPSKRSEAPANGRKGKPKRLTGKALEKAENDALEWGHYGGE